MEAGPFRQRVPRPAGVTLGPPPPWAGAPAAERSAISVDRLAAALDGQVLAGRAAASVLVPVFGTGSRDDAVLVFIRRSSRLARDPGHVAFPGGRVEPGERADEAALREAREEVGLRPEAVRSLGLAGVVERRGSGRVAAFLGVLDGRPELVANAAEVDGILEVPVAALLADGVAWREEWKAGGGTRAVHFFAAPEALGDDLLWGLSARIVWNLLARLVLAP